jgi:hypothetical protein
MIPNNASIGAPVLLLLITQLIDVFPIALTELSLKTSTKLVFYFARKGPMPTKKNVFLYAQLVQYTTVIIPLGNVLRHVH